MPKLVFIGFAAAVLVISSVASAKEVCRQEKIPTKNCNASGCFTTYTTATICKQVPDDTKKAAAGAPANLVATPSSTTTKTTKKSTGSPAARRSTP